VDAVDAGMWEWNRLNIDDQDKMKSYLEEYHNIIQKIHFSYSPIPEDGIKSGSIDYDSSCWDSSFEKQDIQKRINLDMDQDIFKSDSLQHSFVFDNYDIGDNVKMTFGIKKIFITGKEYAYQDETVSLLDFVRNIEGLEDMESRVILVMDPVTICSE